MALFANSTTAPVVQPPEGIRATRTPSARSRQPCGLLRPAAEATHILSTPDEAPQPLLRSGATPEGGGQAVYPCESMVITPIPSGKGSRKKIDPSARAFELPDFGEINRADISTTDLVRDDDKVCATVEQTQRPEFHDHLAKRGALTRHGDTPIVGIRQRLPAPHGGAPIAALKSEGYSLGWYLSAVSFSATTPPAEGLPKPEASSLGLDLSSVPLKSEDSDFSPLLPPAPLQDLPTAFSRRAALFGAVSATGFLAVVGATELSKGYTARLIPSGLDPVAETDPVFAAIEKHRAAAAAFEKSFDESARMVDIPADIEDRQSAAGDAETEARHDMHQVVPTTLAGLAAYVAYWERFTNPPELRMTQLEFIGWEAIPTIAEAMENLLQAGGARG